MKVTLQNKIFREMRTIEENVWVKEVAQYP